MTNRGQVRSGITREEVVGWGGPEVFNQALALCNSGDVTDVAYDDETLLVSGKIEQPSGWAMPVSFKLERGGRIRSNCPCATNQKYGQVCPHVVAIGLALSILEMDDEEAKDEGEQRGEDSAVRPPTSDLPTSKSPSRRSSTRSSRARARRSRSSWTRGTATSTSPRARSSPSARSISRTPTTTSSAASAR